MNATTLEHDYYHLRTELGVSDQGYSHSPEQPIHGTGQGSGNSPMIWCFLSSTLFDCYQTRATGAVYECPDRSLHTKIHMIGYVQTNQFCLDPQPSPRTLLTLCNAMLNYGTISYGPLAANWNSLNALTNSCIGRSPQKEPPSWQEAL